MHLRIIYYYKFSEHNDNIFYKKMQVVYKFVKVFTKVIANYVLVLNFEFKNFFFLLIAKEKTPEILPYMG